MRKNGENVRDAKAVNETLQKMQAAQRALEAQMLSLSTSFRDEVNTVRGRRPGYDAG